jgi:hypothetical protein
MFPILRRHRPRPGDDVEATLPTGSYVPRHARHTIRGVVLRGNILRYHSPITGEAELEVRDLRRAGYTIRVISRR